MTWNDSALGDPLEMLKTLCTLEPSRMISCQPALWDAITPLRRMSAADRGNGSTHILDDMAMIADEEVCAGLGHIDLHTDEACVSLAYSTFVSGIVTISVSW